MKISNVVARVADAFHSGLVNTISDEHRRERSPGHKRLAHDDVLPRRRQAIATDADFHSMRVHRAIIAAAHIIFARPNQLYRRTAKSLRDDGGFARHMTVNHSAAAEATTGEFSMKGNLLRLETEHFAHRHLIHRLKLGRHPGLRTIATEFYRGIEWFHRRVGQIRKFIFSHNAI